MSQRLIWLGGAALIPLVLLAAWLQQLRPLQAQAFAAAVSNTILVDAVLYDGYELNDADEAVALRNVGNEDVDLSGWFLKDGEATDAKLPQGTRLLSGEIIWVAKNKDAFFRQFGFLPDVLVSRWPRLANLGDEVILADSQHQVVDVLVYGNGMRVLLVGPGRRSSHTQRVVFLVKKDKSYTASVSREAAFPLLTATALKIGRSHVTTRSTAVA